MKENAVLFWFYSHEDLLPSRLKLIRHFNPSIPIYALFGGDPTQSGKFNDVVGDFVDDFYTFPISETPYWKWRHGDLMINKWYLDRGRYLSWQRLLVVQWDMLLFVPADELLENLGNTDVLLSGARPVSEVMSWWPWVNPPQSKNHEEFVAFEAHLRKVYGYVGDMYCCLFIVVGLSRAFLDSYVMHPDPELGFLEYKVPSVARALGFRLINHPQVDPWWATDPATARAGPGARALNAGMSPVGALSIIRELLRTDGRRIFHPVNQWWSPFVSEIGAKFAAKF